MKFVLVIAFAILVVASCSPAAAAPWLTDNFDGYATSSLYGQGGWTGDNGPVRVQAGFAESGKAAEVNYKLWGLNNSTQEEEVWRNVNSGGGVQYIDVDVAINSESTQPAGSALGYIKFFNSAGLDITRIYLAHKQINVLFSTGQVPILTNVPAREFHHVRLVINLSTGTLEAWVDGVLKASGATYRPGAYIAQVVIGQYHLGSTYTTAETYVDNLVCSESVVQENVLAGWTSPNKYRDLLTVNPLGVDRNNSPAQMDIDFPQLLAQAGTGTFDQNTIEVMAYDSLGVPKVYDSSRSGYERYLLPWRIQNYYGISKTTLSFVMPDQTYTHYAVYFDTLESGRGKPQRYPGLVGDGDWFSQGYGRREIGPSKFGDMCDFDGDGDLDLFEGGVEPFIYCYENVGGNRMVDRGRLTSGGSLFILPRNVGSNRAWMTVSFCDWDHDGDQDLFPSFTDGPDGGDIVFFRNTTTPGGQPTFARVGEMLTQSGASVGGGEWFPTPTFVTDWDGTGDGLTDVLVARSDWAGGYLYLHRNLGPGGAVGFRLADGVRIQAGGQDINLTTPRFECADVDSDGDLDIVAASHDWGATHVYWYKNTGTRQNPIFAAAVELASLWTAYPGLEVADFDGDGLKDISVGTFWKQVENSEPQSFGAMLKNLGPALNPTFQVRLADSGSLYTEQFQRCDAGQQNGVRAIDWDMDGDKDLVASSAGGLMVYFENLTNNLNPMYGPRKTLMVGGTNPYPIEVTGPESGYARHDAADWNNDGLIDLIVGDEDARVFIYINDGLGNNPPTFRPGYQLWANNMPLDGLKRGSPLICDWNNDGKKDLIFGMAPKQEDLETPFDWPDTGDSDMTNDEGFLFYRNTGTNGNANPGSSLDGAMLAYPSWVMAGGQRITYTRPNLGNFIDWDGDGKKDLIGCDFEDNIRFYKNTGPVAPNTNPQFTSASGITILQDYVTTQMISGVDALDFNGDGDLDLITGQGHGGSNLRFYERDFVEDGISGSFPAVGFAGTTQTGLALAEAKSRKNGDSVNVPKGIVTAAFSGFFYVESEDRLSGIRVDKDSHGRSVGDRVDVVGTIGTPLPNGERRISEATVTPNGTGSVLEMALSGANIGGANSRDYNPVTGAGQMGVTGGIGLNNIGLLVRIFGKCTANVRADFFGARFIFIDDGSGVTSVYRAIGGAYVQVAGVKVDVDDPNIAEGDYVAARGISSIEFINGGYQSKLLPRPDQNDVQKL